jgi:hypothetical protein
VKAEANIQALPFYKFNFPDASAANGSKEPSLLIFCTTANVGYRSIVKNLQQPLRF